MPSNPKEQRETRQIWKQIYHPWKRLTPQERGKAPEPMAQERERETEQDLGRKKEAHAQA